MDLNIEKECSALGGLFQQVMNDMKGSTPVWEDFMNKSTKLHNALKATLMATTAFLDAFQKVADLATGSKGATREIGSALTRLCMRHRSIEHKLKKFTTCMMDVLVSPLQERMEDWKKTLVILDKDHAKDYKKARAEIKKASSDTIRLQKKAKKGHKSDIQTRLDSALQDVNDKYQILEDTEISAVRSALIEERSRFCLFISCLKPVVDEEINMLTEVTHLQEILQHLCLQASDPYNLPSASEQVIADIKCSDGQGWTYQTPPSSPSSLGSRKSSMCSISSINSSSSSGTNKSSPTHNYRNRNSSQSLPAGVIRLSSISSQDSGFTSQDTLFLKPATPPPVAGLKSSLTDSNGSGTDSNATTPSPSYASSSASTWANWPDPPLPAFPRQEGPVERPHTISSAYEKSHNRPSLTSQLFEPPDMNKLNKQQTTNQSSHYAVPYGIPISSSVKDRSNRDSVDYKPPIPGPKPKGKPVAPPVVPDYGVPQTDSKKKNAVVVAPPVYVNQDDLAKMAEEMAKGKGRGHEDIPEEDEWEEDDDVMTPTPRNTQRSLSVPAQEADILADDDEFDMSGLAKVVADLTASTAALNDSSHYAASNVSTFASVSGGMSHKSLPSNVVSASSSDTLDKTTNELSAAIKELEASTAALEMSYDDDDAQTPTNSRDTKTSMQACGASLQGSSGYSTMNSTPNCSEDTITADLDDTLTSIDAELNQLMKEQEKYATLPRRHKQVPGRSQSFRFPSSSMTNGPSQLPSGVPNGSTATIRRSSSSLSSSGTKPPPPIRRNSAMASVHGAAFQVLPPSKKGASVSAPGSKGTTPLDHSPPHHKRSHSDSDKITLPEYHQPPPTAPKPETNKQHNSDTMYQQVCNMPMCENDNDLPPPPPPEMLALDIAQAEEASGQIPIRQYVNGAIDPGDTRTVLQKAHMYDTGQQNQKEQENQKDSQQGSSKSGSSVKRQGSVASSHKDVMQALNQRLSVAQLSPNSSGSVGPVSPVNKSPNSSHCMTESDNDITPTAESPGNSLLAQIQTGVRLRKAYSDDRSHPRTS